jgi:hypothetical protein
VIFHLRFGSSTSAVIKLEVRGLQDCGDGKFSQIFFLGSLKILVKVNKIIKKYKLFGL